MGKIRVRTLGEDKAEDEQKKEAKKRQEGKKTAKAPGLKGGERVVAVGASEEELKKLEEQQTAEQKTPEKKAKKKITQKKKRSRSKAYQAAASMVDRSKTYPLSEALTILAKTHLADFDETVELHINTLETGISGNMTLPHGSGKQIKVAIVEDKLIDEIAKGKIDFDVLLATPQMMPKLAKVAKFLGPRGLMPSPKSGTVTNNPQESAKTYQKGMMRFKTELKAPVIHLVVGKISFGAEKLSDNIKTALNTIQKQNINKVTLKSTMSPGIKIDLAALS